VAGVEGARSVCGREAFTGPTLLTAQQADGHTS
jgi:hypothetical protein